MTLLSQGPCLREKDGYHTEKQEQVPFFSLLPVPTVACHEDSCVPVGSHSPVLTTTGPQRLSLCLTKLGKISHICHGPW